MLRKRFSGLISTKTALNSVQRPLSGPLTDNVVFISDQRIFSLKCTAVLMLATWNMQLATALSKDGFKL